MPAILTIIWAIVWLIAGHPNVHFWAGWAVALAISLVVDVYLILHGYLARRP